jgi:hypothetical protein
LPWTHPTSREAVQFQTLMWFRGRPTRPK